MTVTHAATKRREGTSWIMGSDMTAHTSSGELKDAEIALI